jgi:hypothetical protein
MTKIRSPFKDKDGVQLYADDYIEYEDDTSMEEPFMREGEDAGKLCLSTDDSWYIDNANTADPESPAFNWGKVRKVNKK